MSNNYGIFTNLGAPDVVFLIDGESTIERAIKRTAEWQNKTLVNADQRFWFHAFPAGMTPHVGRMLGGDAIRYAYPMDLAINDAEKAFQAMTIDQRLNARYYEPAPNLYKFERNLYNLEYARLAKQFIRDLAIELGLEGHPKFDALYNKAYSMGYGNGLHEVLSYARELVDLIQ